MSPGDPSFDADDVIPTNPWPSSDWVAHPGGAGAARVRAAGARGGHARLGRLGQSAQRGATPALARGPHHRRHPDRAWWWSAAFDAVLLLPAPTFFVWTTIGALASTARPIRELPLQGAARRRVVAAVGATGGVLVLYALAQVFAMAIGSGGDRSAQELAARLDPGSYRIHIALAQEWRRAGRCDRARPHAEQARDLFPRHPAPHLVLRACRKAR